MATMWLPVPLAANRPPGGPSPSSPTFSHRGLQMWLFYFGLPQEEVDRDNGSHTSWDSTRTSSLWLLPRVFRQFSKLFIALYSLQGTDGSGSLADWKARGLGNMKWTAKHHIAAKRQSGLETTLSLALVRVECTTASRARGCALEWSLRKE